ncbi:unknown [Clostridium sp. CAG:62]|nr:unknown [Clostridium sp. CAG:62]
MWKEYYTDGVTKRTDSLYICSCSCGKCYWSCTYQKQCSECGRDLISCEPASKKRTVK